MGLGPIYKKAIEAAHKAALGLLVFSLCVPSSLATTTTTNTIVTVSTATITNGTTVSTVVTTSTSYTTTTDTSTSVTTTAPLAPSNQAGSQQNAGNANNLASMLGKAVGVLSMAAGGLYMAKGAQELNCCVQGCPTSGGKSIMEMLGLKTVSEGGASDVTKAAEGAAKRQPIDYKKLRFPDEAKNTCPVRPSSPALGLVYDLVNPQKAEAGGGCIDAALALATGGLMMLNGIMGLAAADKAGQNGATAMNNSTGMGTLGGGAGDSTGNGAGNGTGPGTSSLGGDGIKMDPALLRTGKADAIMGQFEKQFGIGRDNFAESVFNKEDPRKILNTAPRNPISADNINKAMRAAGNMSDADKANTMARTGFDKVQSELMAKLGDTPAPGNGSGGASLTKISLGSSGAKDEELDALDARTPSSMGVSPEVTAALLAKELDDQKKNEVNFTLFQIVHKKYREKTKSIFGYDPDGAMKGVGNADGL